MDKIAILEGVAEAWNSRGITYSVCHGLEGYPHAVGRDLDVMVSRRQLRSALGVAAEHLRSAGFAVFVPPDPWGATWLFAVRNPVRLEIDLIPFLFRGPVLISAAAQPVGRVGPFRVDPWASFAKRVLMPILGGGLPGEPILGAGEEAVSIANCRGILGRRLTQKLFACLHGADAQGLRDLASRLRTTSVARAMCLHPLRSLRLFPHWLGKSILPRFNRCAPILALVGPDGVGKTTTLQALVRTSPDPFCGFVTRHWRPGILPRPGSLVGRPASLPDASGLQPPRREPGRLHWLRMVYYYVDFSVGHFFRDRFDSSRLRIVLYDRHALDMIVDPVRYGLSSSRGTRMFWRLIPKPDIVVLLFDEPRQIQGRKAELTEEEIARQLGEWVKLARDGCVGAVVRADGGPDNTALAVRELIFEAFVERNRRHAWKPKAENTRDWVKEMLSMSVGRPGAGQRVLAADFGRIRMKHGREFLIPLRNRGTALSALRLYRPQKVKSRIAARLLSAAIQAGVGPRVLHRMSLVRSDDGAQSLTDYLQHVLGRQDVVFAVSSGAAGPPRKPVLLIMTIRGEPLGYAKIGWNEQTCLLVENERRALEFFAGQAMEHGVFPRAMHFGTWSGKTVLLTEPLDLGDGRRSTAVLEDLHVRFLAEVAHVGLKREKFSDSGFLSDLLADMDSLRTVMPSYQMRVLENAVALVTSRLGSRELPFVWRVGDFVPWNIGVDNRAGKVTAVDLEYAGAQSIPGWDLFHFLYQSGAGFQARLQPATRGTDGAWQQYFRALDVDREAVPLLQVAYLVSLCLLRTRLWNRSGSERSAEAMASFREMSGHTLVLTEMIRSKGGAAR